MWGAFDPKWSDIARRMREINPGEWVRLKLLVRGEHVVLHVNDLPVQPGRYPAIDGVDDRYAGGGIGLRKSGGTAQFRNLVLREAPQPERGPGYTNPVQTGCADPVVLFHDGLYYAYCTHTPDWPRMVNGIRMYTSPDLVHWSDGGYVLKNEDSWGNARFWAPDIVKKEGTFYLYYAADTRICVATADSPEGKELFIVYHRHCSLTQTEPRQLAIDRIQFVPQTEGPDILEVHGPTSTPQPMPSGTAQQSFGWAVRDACPP